MVLIISDLSLLLHHTNDCTKIPKFASFVFRCPLPPLEGKSNVTILDTQLLKLRLRALEQIHEAAVRMRSEATDLKSTLVEIEDWLEKLMQLTEEVGVYRT